MLLKVSQNDQASTTMDLEQIQQELVQQRGIKRKADEDAQSYDCYKKRVADIPGRVQPVLAKVLRNQADEEGSPLGMSTGACAGTDYQLGPLEVLGKWSAEWQGKTGRN